MTADETMKHLETFFLYSLHLVCSKTITHGNISNRDIEKHQKCRYWKCQVFHTNVNIISIVYEPPSTPCNLLPTTLFVIIAFTKFGQISSKVIPPISLPVTWMTQLFYDKQSLNNAFLYDERLLVHKTY